MGPIKALSMRTALVFIGLRTTFVRIRKVIREAEEAASRADASDKDIAGFRLAAYEKIRSIVKNWDDPRFMQG
ncbi:MAG: hypothetical protein JSU92_05145 [Deltaproteobacteria bacterium]|nr:MAG: hypothetical protein JSU92_05145 [Deltaproteobacteria bacterium]